MIQREVAGVLVSIAEVLQPSEHLRGLSGLAPTGLSILLMSVAPELDSGWGLTRAQ